MADSSELTESQSVANDPGVGTASAPATSSVTEKLESMHEVHAPHQSVHTWKDFLVHIAAITIGLLMALGLEAAVAWFHHRHQAHQAFELLIQEVDRNRIALLNDMRSIELAERNHHAALAVLRRLRSGNLNPDDHLIWIRNFNPLGSSAWKIVHESGAAAYLPYVLMARYGEIYDTQQSINDSERSAYAELQRAISVLNTETEDQSRDQNDRIQREAETVDALAHAPDSRSDAEANDINSRLSGNPDLRGLTPAQIDRLDQGFQQAITDDRRLHRRYVNLDILYAALAK